jgi:hypothetical protein
MSKENEEILEKIIEREKNKIEKDFEERINYAVASAKTEFKEYIEKLIKASKIALPVNIIDILAKGGHVIVEDAFLDVRDDVRITIAGLPTYSWTPTKAGKYRVVLIIEPLEEVEKK